MAQASRRGTLQISPMERWRQGRSPSVVTGLMVAGCAIGGMVTADLYALSPAYANETETSIAQAQNTQGVPVLPPRPSSPSPSPSLSPSTESALPIIDASSAPPAVYVLGPGDRLQVEVFEAPEYSGDFEVLADGSLRLPFVDTIPARGRTLDEVSTLISQRYASILRRPLVSVQLIETRPIMLAVTGEVNRPGAYSIPLTDMEGLPTVTQAIQLAGGITQSANIRSIQVQRETPQAQQPDGVIVVDLWKLLQDADLRQDIALQDGDRIIIPKATALELAEASELASANFSPDAVTVNIVGEVNSPGSIQVPPNTPLNQAILAAGGFNNRARRGQVDLVRLNPNGTVTKREIDVDLAESSNDETNPLLLPNDTVIVNRSAFARTTDVLGRALSPITAVFSLFRIFGL